MKYHVCSYSVWLPVYKRESQTAPPSVSRFASTRKLERCNIYRFTSTNDINTVRSCYRPRDLLYTAIYGRVDVASGIVIICELSSRPRYANSSSTRARMSVCRSERRANCIMKYVRGGSISAWIVASKRHTGESRRSLRPWQIRNRPFSFYPSPLTYSYCVETSLAISSSSGTFVPKNTVTSISLIANVIHPASTKCNEILISLNIFSKLV